MTIALNYFITLCLNYLDIFSLNFDVIFLISHTGTPQLRSDPAARLGLTQGEQSRWRGNTVCLSFLIVLHDRLADRGRIDSKT